jgi:hypothetical protein
MGELMVISHLPSIAMPFSFLWRASKWRGIPKTSRPVRAARRSVQQCRRHKYLAARKAEKYP